MNKELKFSRLSEVEKVESVSANACALVEDEGKIKRVTGGLGGGEFIFNVTPFFEDAEFYESSEEVPEFPEVPIVVNDDFVISLTTPLTEEQFLLLKDKMRQGPITIGGEMKEDGVTLSVYEKYSTQFASFEEDDFELGLLMPLGSVCSLIAVDSETGAGKYIFGYIVRLGEHRMLKICFVPLLLLFMI